MEEIVKRAVEGDTAALNALIERYQYLILKEASKYHVPGYEYEDLVQHGYLSVIKSVHKYRLGSNSADGYIIRSIKNNFKDLLKGKIKHLREKPYDPQKLNPIDYELTIEDQVIAYTQVEKLYGALDKLASEERDIVERFYLRDDTLKEIACDMDMTYHKAVKMKEIILEKLKELI